MENSWPSVWRWCQVFLWALAWRLFQCSLCRSVLGHWSGGRSTCYCGNLLAKKCPPALVWRASQSLYRGASSSMGLEVAAVVLVQEYSWGLAWRFGGHVSSRCACVVVQEGSWAWVGICSRRLCILLDGCLLKRESTGACARTRSKHGCIAGSVGFKDQTSQCTGAIRDSSLRDPFSQRGVVFVGGEEVMSLLLLIQDFFAATCSVKAGRMRFLPGHVIGGGRRGRVLPLGNLVLRSHTGKVFTCGSEVSRWCMLYLMETFWGSITQCKHQICVDYGPLFYLSWLRQRYNRDQQKMMLSGALTFAAQVLSGSCDNLFACMSKTGWKVYSDKCPGGKGSDLIDTYPEGKTPKIATWPFVIMLVRPVCRFSREVERASCNLMAPHFHSALESLKLLAPENVEMVVPWWGWLVDCQSVQVFFQR